MQYFQNVPLVKDLLDAAPEIFLILNEQRQAVYSNRTLLDVLHVAEDEFENGLQLGELLKCIHAGESMSGCGTTEFCRTCGAVRAIMSALNGRRDVQECRVIREDGTALDLEVTATPLYVQDRRFTAFSARDISHEKRRHALEHVFFHDLLNTASGVVGFAELLVTAPAEESGEYITHLYQLANRLIDEIRSQKALLDAENDLLEIVVSPIASVELLTQVAQEYAHPDLAQGRRIVVDPQAEIGGDADQPCAGAARTGQYGAQRARSQPARRGSHAQLPGGAGRRRVYRAQSGGHAV